MILVDTSVWANHLRQPDANLQQALIDQQVLMHPFVLGEIACGNLRHRASILSDLSKLPLAVSAENYEVLALIERHRLFGKGIAWIDAHLLTSALLTHCRLWSDDVRLHEIAVRFKIA
jgi:predicted nucleic acid-binding protein